MLPQKTDSKMRYASKSIPTTLAFLIIKNPKIISLAMSTCTTKAAGKAASRHGIFMIMSPAKTLDLTPIPLEDLETTRPACDAPKTLQLAQILKSKTRKQLKDFLKVSDKISESVKNYYDAFEMMNNDEQNENDDEDEQANMKPAVFSFDGPAFKGINPSTCDSNTINYMQANLRIVDPLYGALRPLDMIQPYRLEMANKAIMKDLKAKAENSDDNGDKEYKSLANWWKGSVTSSISSDMKESESTVLVNLASDEYAATVDADELLNHNCRFIKIAFQQEGKVIAVHAKRARGLMVRYISENQLEDVDGIRQFDLDGYGFCEDKSNGNVIVFDRRKNWNDGEEKEPSGSKKRKGKKRSEKLGTCKKAR